MGTTTERGKRRDGQSPPSHDVGTSSASSLISEAARGTMRTEIEAAGGNEVFFIGKTDEHGIVAEVAVRARGNDEAVSAFLGSATPGDVVIHNHPSGPLAPSDADIGFSSTFGDMSVGSYIVDNPVQRVYVVVPVLGRIETKKIDLEQATAMVRPGGAIGQGLASYEFRRQQVDMMEEVIRAFDDDEIALIEAATGTGKTVAYLIPAVLWATTNGERVVVSTNTINLQEQLIHKDIPMLRRVLGIEFEAILMKGRGNYICLRKLDKVASDIDLFSTSDDRKTLADIIAWARKSRDGDRSQLSFVPPEHLWEKVCSEADFCLRARCPHFKDCFVNRARRKASQSDIIVTNHHLLFADIALRKQLGSYSDLAVLPPYRRLVIDEAHNVEDVATSYLGERVTRTGLARIIGRLHRYERVRRSAVEKGIVPFLRAKIGRAKDAFTENQVKRLLSMVDGTIVPLLEELLEVVSVVFDSVFEFVERRSPETGLEKKLRITGDVRASDEMRALCSGDVEPLVAELTAAAGKLGVVAAALSKAKSKDEKDDFTLDQAELNAYAMKFRTIAAFIAQLFGETGQEDTVQWIETKGAGRRVVRLCSAPLDVSSALVETVYPNIRTIVMTSATLSVEGRLDFLKRRLGLDCVEQGRVSERILPSPFDFDKQAVIGVPLDIADPASPQYIDQAAEMIMECLRITRGKAFVLFTSFGALNYVAKKLREPLKEEGVTSLRQGSAPRHKLLGLFKKDVHSVLFATDSFWEGVDVAGEALECVILAKLPFRVPTEPVLEARAEKIERDGGNSFVEYTVPQAVIRFRQGFGRLIRRRSDRGAIIILDNRVLTRSYGSVFLRSLPDARLICTKQEEVLAAVREFFEGDID
jgi:ATP-dependent DNA helicase DinG